MKREQHETSNASEYLLELSDGQESSREGDDKTTSSGSEELDPGTKDIPFGQLLTQQQDGKTGRQKMQYSQQAPGKIAKQQGVGGPAKPKLKRENKNRPVEMSSKKPVPRLRQVIEAPSRKTCDPRTDKTTGKYKDDVFRKRYAFIFDENLPQERQDTVKRLKRAKSAARKKELQGNLTRIQQQILDAKEDRKRQRADAEAKAKEREAVKQGKRPFFLKRSEKKRQELVRRFQDLKATGRLDKVMAKKRKKNASKDHRYMPSARR